MKALGIMLDTISDEVLEIGSPISTPSQLWSRLKEHFFSSTKINKYATIRNFLTCKMEEGGDVMEYLVKIKNLRDMYKSLEINYERI